MAKTKVVLDSKGIVEILKSSGVENFLRDRMASVAIAAADSAPRSSGNYADSFSVEIEQRKDRVVVQVINTAPYAMAVEARTGNLARAMDSA